MGDAMTIRDTLDERGKRYGDYRQMCKLVQSLKYVMRNADTQQWLALPDSHKEALDLMSTKIGRILTGDPNDEDSWLDLIGYATLVLEQIRKTK